MNFYFENDILIIIIFYVIINPYISYKKINLIVLQNIKSIK